MGSDYLLQLIDLTLSHSPLISPDRLVRETTSRLHDLPSYEPLSAFISSLRSLDFKLTVCALYLAQHSRDGLSQVFPGGTPSKTRIFVGSAVRMSKDASSPRRAEPYPHPQTDSLESALLLTPEIDGS